MRLKEIREEKNLTQDQIAKAINTSQTNIGRWERGINEPTASLIIALADYLKCSTDFLLGKEDDFGFSKNQTKTLPLKEQKLLQFFSLLDEDEKDKIIEDCEFFANKKLK